MNKARTVVAAAVCTAAAVGVAPAGAAPAPRVPHVLVYHQTLGFHHQSIEPALQTLRKIVRLDQPFTLETSEDPAVLTPAKLAKTDVVVWLNNTAASDGASPFTDAQEQAYVRWMSCGGGHVGVHAAVDSYGEDAFPAYVEANGAMFTLHPITATSALDDQDHDNEGWGEPEHTIAVRDQRSPITAPWHGQKTFQLHEELYNLDRDPAKTVTNYRPLLTHVSVDDPQGQVAENVFGAYAEDAPMAWTGSYRGKNRTFYTNLGHSRLSWKDADFLRHLVNGITWTAAGKRARTC